MEPTPEPSPETIPVEGDVQIFADPDCTQYATGIVSTVYARVNVPWVGVNSGWGIEGTAPRVQDDSFLAQAPESEEEILDGYAMIAWIDYFSDSQNNPFEAGQVVELNAGSEFVTDVTNFTKVFSRPE